MWKFRYLMTGFLAALFVSCGQLEPQNTITGGEPGIGDEVAPLSKQFEFNPFPPVARTQATERDWIILRAYNWLQRGVTYNVNANDPETGHRRDCSGFVSMAWNLPKPSPNSATIVDHANYVFGGENLQPGDALTLPRTASKVGHIILFAAWKDRASLRFEAWDMYSTGKPARVRDYNLVYSRTGYGVSIYKILYADTNSYMRNGAEFFPIKSKSVL